MRHSRGKLNKPLPEKYPPSAPCACDICLSYCARPGWWTVKEASRAIDAGYAGRMMVEVSPERTFIVLSPALKGCEGIIALQNRENRCCTFLQDKHCELHGSGLQPLECRFCHHDRPGKGLACHADLEKDWNTPAGQELVERWRRQTGFLKTARRK